MTVADLARELTQRYLDAVPIADWVSMALERLGVPPAMREPLAAGELCAILRRVMEDQAVEHFTIAELAALARFYATPEGASVMRKMVAFGTVVTPAIQGRGESRGSERSPPGSARNPHPAR